MSEAKTVASELKRWREREGYSQARVADEMDVGRIAVNQIERERCALTPAMALKLEKLTAIDAKRWMWWDICRQVDQIKRKK